MTPYLEQLTVGPLNGEVYRQADRQTVRQTDRQTDTWGGVVIGQRIAHGRTYLSWGLTPGDVRIRAGISTHCLFGFLSKNPKTHDPSRFHTWVDIYASPKNH